ncbi:hypothetical protein C7447_1059 [Tenacibaculum adriaticum]|uniref:Uncharacterized protein n=1 Tax=Tenacibaculum adriaticum TaxID=413713 RepID=A0A5S5DPP5_9FLAO|nr:DUF6095 family protein [Tenacibaculum adriaticum]TYP96996.1 hypothetical protein C7447_1059 [Tenacibaculum adriaticum]
MEGSPYEKPLKRLLILLGLLIISPIVLNVAFKALKIYTENPGVLIAYALLVIGICMILFTVYFGFKTFQSFLDVLFRK